MSSGFFVVSDGFWVWMVVVPDAFDKDMDHLHSVTSSTVELSLLHFPHYSNNSAASSSLSTFLARAR